MDVLFMTKRFISTLLPVSKYKFKIPNLRPIYLLLFMGCAGGRTCQMLPQRLYGH
uniref:Uncharacterized protein n=1 Tax=Anguilla anguilla TaxID=7936 RepID=A0A0E9RLP4_ANGAN